MGLMAQKVLLCPVTHWRQERSKTEEKRGEGRGEEERNVHRVSLRPQVCHGLPLGRHWGWGTSLMILACALGRGGWRSRGRRTEEGAV